MSSSKQPRVVVVTRPSWYQELLARHGTHQQARFFLEQRKESLEPVLAMHEQFQKALECVLHAVPVEWRRARVQRDQLDRFLFEPDDVVIALGQDGLVANTAKYLDGQPVIGVNPSPEHYAGVLVPMPPSACRELLQIVVAGEGEFEERSMVQAQLDDGQRLLALNEIFVGQMTHQSARYVIQFNKQEEYQSSSGVIVSTGTGATGWAASIHRERASELPLPAPTDRRLVFFTREAWPSATTGVELTEGTLRDGAALVLTSRMNDGGVVFGDGIEQDRLEFNWGRTLRLKLATTRLRLLVG